MAVYDRLTLAVLSGTGNSYRTARWMEESATGEGVPAAIIPIERPIVSPFGDDQPSGLLGVVFPVHAFTAPWLVLRYLFELPSGGGTHAFVTVPRGAIGLGKGFIPGMEGTAGYLAALILALRGYRVRGVTGIDLPANWFALHPAQTPAATAFLRDRAKPRIEAFVREILSGGSLFRGWLPLCLGLMLLPLSVLYLIVGRFFLAALFFADERCTGCGQCAASCPAKVIRMTGPKGKKRPVWNPSCESCQRCMAYCPERAVQANYLLVAVIVAASVFLGKLIPDTVATGLPSIANGAIRFIIELGCSLAVILIVGKLAGWLTRNSAIARFCALLSPTRYYRRTPDPETRLGDLTKK